jgi:hypothetical protein
MIDEEIYTPYYRGGGGLLLRTALEAIEGLIKSDHYARMLAALSPRVDKRDYRVNEQFFQFTITILCVALPLPLP